MRILVDNLNLPLRVVQTVFIVLGFWTPAILKGYKKLFVHLYTFVSFMSIIGSYIIIQLGYLCQVWGNVSLMTGVMFLLFTNISLSIKIFSVYCRRKAIKAMIAEVHAELSAEIRPKGLSIVKSCNRETTLQLCIFILLTYLSLFGMSFGVEKGELPIRAWYPYDATKSPAYELTYAHQFIALSISACLNVCSDTMATSLMSQCQCRINLLSLSLRTLFNGLIVSKQGLTSPEDDTLLALRLRRCVEQHQMILNQAAQLQKFFSIPIFGQFIVSAVIICATAYQLATTYESLMLYFSMVMYLAVMLLQLFLYCYHGNQLVTESGKVADAVYECPWYRCSPAQRRSLLLMMVRAQRETILKAGNLTELSLPTFMAIVKASYTFFTVLQTIEDGPQEEDIIKEQ